MAPSSDMLHRSQASRFLRGISCCRTDTVRARIAAGLFERIAEWNGFGRVLLASTAGIEADPAAPPGELTRPIGIGI